MSRGTGGVCRGASTGEQVEHPPAEPDAPQPRFRVVFLRKGHRLEQAAYRHAGMRLGERPVLARGRRSGPQAE